MNTMKRLLCCTLVLLFVFSAASAFAAESDSSEEAFRNNAYFLQEYRAVQDQMIVYCAGLDMYGLDEAEVSVTLNKEPIKILDADTTAGENVTYYCLVDVSGSILPEQMDAAKKVLRALVDAISSGDRVVIARLGDTLESSGYLSSKSEMRDKIDALRVTSQDTNLYRGIAEALTELDTSKEASGRKCLIVLSDGVDDSDVETGRTKDEAERSITDTRIPVYTVAEPGVSSSAGKIMGSLARLSVGGVDYTYETKGITSEKIGEDIVKDMQSDLMLLLDLGGFWPSNDELLLTVTYRGEDGVTYGDAMTVYAENLLLSPTPVPPTPTPVIETPEPTDIVVHWWEKIPTWAYIAGGAGLLAIIALIVVLLILRARRKHREEEEEERRRREQEEAERNRQSGSFVVDFPGGETVSEVKPAARPTVRFTAIGNTSYSVALPLVQGKNTVLGRDGRAEMILNPNDPQLSGVQCVVRLEGKSLLVHDAGSKNGTSVNGIRLGKNEVKLNGGDTLGVGSLTYRIQFL